MKQIARFTTVPALALCSLPSGCAGGSRFAQDAQVPQDKAVVYIYKKGGFAGSANSFKIYANNKHIFNLRNGAYFPYHAAPGPLALGTKLRPGLGLLIEGAINKPTDSLFINAVAGNTYYAALKVGFFGPFFDKKLVQVPRETAEREIKGCSLAAAATD